MANKTVSFRLPSELIEAIEAEAQATGQSKTNVVITALTRSYGCSHSFPQSATTEQLQQQLDDLKQEIVIISNANQLYQLIIGADTPIQPSSAVNAILSSISPEQRLKWIHDTLHAAAQKERLLQTLEPKFNEECYLPLGSQSHGRFNPDVTH
ncbi:MAG: hypothetical protein QNJ46_15120 [Leptolyngbyaceae cyanobacterium MO_188.B28]|nr:hypothetical protein [Leptolyngbyaceae cyanobacterium MO_188.B28]